MAPGPCAPPMNAIHLGAVEVKSVSLNLIISALEPEPFEVRPVKLRCGVLGEPSTGVVKPSTDLTNQAPTWPLKETYPGTRRAKSPGASSVTKMLVAPDESSNIGTASA